MRLSKRLKRIAWLLFIGVALVVLAYGLLLLTYIASAIAFSGSTGENLTQFFDGLAPIAAALVLAAVFGWVVCLVNAMTTSEGWWSKSIVAAVFLGGAVAAAHPAPVLRLASAPLSLIALLQSRVLQGPERERASDEALALAFVAANATALEAAGGTPNLALASRRMTREGVTVEYDVSVAGERTVYAIVRVGKVEGKPNFYLACITPLSSGHRESGKDVCAADAPRRSQ